MIRYRFVEVQYNRNPDFRASVNSRPDKEEPTEPEAKSEEASQKTKSFDINGNVNDESYVEHTVIFLPNVWSLMPNSAEYKNIVEAYKNFVDNPPEKEKPENQAEAASDAKSQETAANDGSTLAVKESSEGVRVIFLGAVEAIARRI